MVFILDNTLVNLISQLKAISVELKVEEGYDEQLEVDYKTGTFLDQEYTIMLDNQFTIICYVMVSEVKYGHKLDRKIVVDNIVVLDYGGLVSLTLGQSMLLQQTLYNLVTIKNSII